MNSFETPAKNSSSLPLSRFKMYSCISLGVVIGIVGFLAVYVTVKEAYDNRAILIPPNGNEDSNTVSQEFNSETEDSFDEQLTDPTLHRNTVQRFATVYSFVASLSESEILDTLHRITEENWIQSVRVREAIQTALVERLVVHSPQQALTFARAQNSSHHSKWIQTIFSDWASSDLDAALVAARQLEKSNQLVALKRIIEAREDLSLARLLDIGDALNLKTHAVAHYISSLNTEYIVNPKKRWYELVAVAEADSTAGHELVSRIALMWFQKDGINVLEEIQSSDAGDRFQGNSINLILESVAKEDPVQAFQYAKDIPQEGVFQMFPPTFRVVSVWARVDPIAALEVLQDFEPSGMRERLQNSAVNAWADANPIFLLENLETIPPATKVTAVRRAFSSLARSAPAHAGDLVLQLEDPQLRADAAQALVYQWSQADVQATTEWVQEYPKDESVREQLLQTALEAMVSLDPNRAIKIASEQPIPEGREIGLEAGLISALAFRDVDAAIEFLPEAREGATRVVVYRSVGVSLVANGEPEKALSFVQELPDSAKPEFYRSVAFEWAKFDPPAVLSAMKVFPTAEIRSEVANELSRFHSQNFSESEMETLKTYIIEKSNSTQDE